ncbi:MAG: non-canonical purine NTP diphosphatase [Bacteroidales bacterium]|nr:non-canonical purine NTP diphosphatase [Bacteroidales bacterium]
MNEPKLIFATHNKHKLEEVKLLLNNEINLLSLTDISFFDEIPEEEDTLEGNARQKAKFIFDLYHQDCFSDDTGLEVLSLSGAPGVHSARYAGEGHNDAMNRRKLLEQLKGIQNRTARFRTVVALWWKGTEYLFEGIVKGEIIAEERGDNGFGYDSLFVPEGYDKTFAEMGEKEKNEISHRGKAIKKLAQFLEERL